jgi:hypothetical protein
MRNLFKTLFFLLPLMAFGFFACNNDDDRPIGDPPLPSVETGKLNLTFENQYDPLMGVDLELGKVYTTLNGDSIKIDEIRYWVSNIKLYTADGLAYDDSDGYYLIEKTASNTREEISFADVPYGTYTKMQFSIGVDSARNDTLGANIGELSLSDGMFWAWKIGYKFLLMNGQYYSTDSSSYQDYKAHTGLNSYFITKEVNLSAPLVLDETDEHEIHFMAGLGRVFNAPNQLDVKVRDWQFFSPNEDYDKMTENIENMFMLHHVE